MLPVEDAVGLILANSPAPETINMPVNGSLVGYVLAEDVKANDPVPAYRASIVDGYAVIVSENGPSTKGMFPVASISHAAPGEIPTLQRGQIARITTGAPLPPGANSVVMVEDTVLRSMTDDSQEEKVVEILTDQVKADENIREIGSDIKAGEVVLRKGEEITAVGGELGLLASVGKAEVMVYRKPVIGVLSTGDEIVMHDRPGPLHLGEVRDCNRPTLMAAIKGWGFQVVDYGIAKDKCVPPSCFIITSFTIFPSPFLIHHLYFTHSRPLHILHQSSSTISPLPPLLHHFSSNLSFAICSSSSLLEHLFHHHHFRRPIFLYHLYASDTSDTLTIRPGSLEEHLRNALRNVDVIVTSGGVSMGELDLLKPTLERSLGGTIHFGRVNMKPGKPTTFATVPLKTNDGNQATKLVFSLPGNPASALVTSHLFVLPSLQYSSGKQGPHGLPRVKAQLEEDVRCDPKRPEYHRVSLSPGPNGLLHATSTGGQRSSKVASLRRANGLLCLPAKEWTAPKGEVVDALLMGGL